MVPVHPVAQKGGVAFRTTKKGIGRNYLLEIGVFRDPPYLMIIVERRSEIKMSDITTNENERGYHLFFNHSSKQINAQHEPCRGSFDVDINSE